MTEQIKKYFGICENCIYVKECINAAKAKNPIWFCELFDISEHPTAKKSTKLTNNHPETIKEDNKNNYQYTGLCINCDHREKCAYSKSEGGIWHCDQYQ